MFNDDFKKLIIKYIKKTSKYKLMKREIGKIKNLQFAYIENKVIRADAETYCEKIEIQVSVNNKLSCTLNLYTDGTVELFD